MGVNQSEVNMNCIIVERTSVRYILARIADLSPLNNIAAQFTFNYPLI